MSPEPEEKKIPWYYRGGGLVTAFLVVGPLMLPLVWLHPTMTRSRKMLWTVVLLILSYFLVVVTMESFKKIGDSYQQLKTLVP